MNIAEFIKALSGFAWLAVVGLGVLAVIRASRNQNAKGIGSLVIGMIVLALVLTLVGAGLVFIEPTEAGVVITILGEGGLRPEPLTPGLHWIVPFIERVDERFTNWLAQQDPAGTRFSPEQLEWLGAIKDHIASSYGIEKDDFDLEPFVGKGGLFKVYQLFGARLEPMLDELNKELVA